MSDNEENKLSKEALKFIKANKKVVIAKFADDAIYPLDEHPSTVFLAGAPGVGKTEFAKSYNKELVNAGFSAFVHIDADQIRSMLPQFNGENSDTVQQATNKGVEFLFDHVQKRFQSAIVDGTFSSYDVARKDIRRALGRKRFITIYYIYQKPHLAWDYTKKRYAVEGRAVTKEFFIESLVKSEENVNRVKNEFGDKVRLSLLTKDYENKRQRFYFNIQRIDQHLDVDYNKGQLFKELL